MQKAVPTVGRGTRRDANHHKLSSLSHPGCFPAAGGSRDTPPTAPAFGNAWFAAPGNGARRKGGPGLGSRINSSLLKPYTRFVFSGHATLPSHGAGAWVRGHLASGAEGRAARLTHGRLPAAPTGFSTGVSGHSSLLPGLLRAGFPSFPTTKRRALALVCQGRARPFCSPVLGRSWCARG